MSKQDLKNKYNRVAFDNSQLQMFAEDVIDGEIVKEGMQNPMTAAGDVIVGGASGAPAKLALGAAGQILAVDNGAPAWVKNNPAEIQFLSTAPTEDNTDGSLKFVVLSEEPATYFDGYYYIITESEV